MKKSTTSKKRAKVKSSSGKLYLRLAQPGKKLSELVSVYEDLERTLKRLKTNALLQRENSLMQINIQKLITQLSKSKRKIERKISHTLLIERSQIRHQLDKWAPGLGRRISRPSRRTSIENRQPN